MINLLAAPMFYLFWSILRSVYRCDEKAEKLLAKMLVTNRRTYFVLFFAHLGPLPTSLWKLRYNSPSPMSRITREKRGILRYFRCRNKMKMDG